MADPIYLSQPSDLVNRLADSLPLVEAALIVWILVYATRPLYRALHALWRGYLETPDGGQLLSALREKGDDGSFRDFILRWWRDSTDIFLKKMDRIYQFEHMNEKWAWSNLQWPPFVGSLLLTYLYFYGFTLAVFYRNLSEAIAWQLVFLIGLNVVMFYGVMVRGKLRTAPQTKDIYPSIGAGAVAVAGAVAGAGAGAGAGAVAGAGAGAGAVTGAVTGADEKPEAIKNLVDLLNQLTADNLAAYPDYFYFALLMVFLILPWLNALLDWVSVTLSRWMFARSQANLTSDTPSITANIWFLLWDLAIAVLLKLSVLLLLYVSARVFAGLGVAFEVGVVQAYFANINPLDACAFQAGALWDSPASTMISLMISTTLLPSLVHVLHLSFTLFLHSVQWFAFRAFRFTVASEKVFAAVVSVGVVGGLLSVLVGVIEG